MSEHSAWANRQATAASEAALWWPGAAALVSAAVSQQNQEKHHEQPNQHQSIDQQTLAHYQQQLAAQQQQQAVQQQQAMQQQHQVVVQQNQQQAHQNNANSTSGVGTQQLFTYKMASSFPNPATTMAQVVATSNTAGGSTGYDYRLNMAQAAAAAAVPGSQWWYSAANQGQLQLDANTAAQLQQQQNQQQQQLQNQQQQLQNQQQQIQNQQNQQNQQQQQIQNQQAAQQNQIQQAQNQTQQNTVNASAVENFLTQNKLPLKALLVLDNAPSHPPADELVKETTDGKIWVLYMPPNVTPLIQPMDQNAIRLLKLHYKNTLLSRLFATGTQDVCAFLKTFTLYDAITAIVSGWKSVSGISIAKCWNKLLKNNEHYDEEDDLPLSSFLRHDEDTLAMRNGIRLLNSIFPNSTPTRGAKPDAKPRGRMTAYAYFVQTCREEHKKKHPDETVIFAEFSRKCAERWKTMVDKEKKRFHEMAEKDKARYEMEMSNYVPPKGTVVGRGKKRKMIKDPNAPKRSLSAFFWFCNDERNKVKALNPEYGVGDIAKELGRKWSDVDPEVKHKYELMAEKDKARYEKEMTEYKTSGKIPASAPSMVAQAQAAQKAALLAAAAQQQQQQQQQQQHVDDDDGDGEDDENH